MKATGARIGELKQLDTKNPVLYLEFSEGRLKLFGTIMHCKTRYLSLNYRCTGTAAQAQKQGLQCRGIFHSYIAFADYHWVGKKDENPNEKPMSLPSALQARSKELKEAYEQTKAKGAPSAMPCERICTRRTVSTRRSVRPLPAAAQS